MLKQEVIECFKINIYIFVINHMIKKFIYFEIIKNLIILVILVELAVHVILFILFYINYRVIY